MLKLPSTISLLIFFIFIVIRPGRFNSVRHSYECERFFHGIYNWDIFIPIYSLLLIFSLIECWRLRIKVMENIFSLILLLPVILYILFFFAKGVFFLIY